MSLLSVFGCFRTTTEVPTSLGDLRVEIAIEHLVDRQTDSAPYARKRIKAELSNTRGRKIEREDVRLEVNGIPLEFRVAQGNYYDRHPYYQLSDDKRLPLAPASDYRFTLVLPNGARHDVGTVRMPANLDLEQFTFAKQRPASGEVVVAWRELAAPTALTVFRSDIRREADGTEVHVAGSANDPAALRRTIGPGWLRRRSGEWAVPAKFLAENADGRISAVSADIRILHEGQLAGTFAKGSTITAERRLTLRMECAPDAGAN